MQRLWKDYSLAFVLLFAWWVMWALYAWALWMFNQRPNSYWWEFWSTTLENLQSENYQTLFMAAMTAAFIWKGSSESRDSDDEMKAALERIEQKLTGRA